MHIKPNDSTYLLLLLATGSHICNCFLTTFPTTHHLYSSSDIWMKCLKNQVNLSIYFFVSTKENKSSRNSHEVVINDNVWSRTSSNFNPMTLHLFLYWQCSGWPLDHCLLQWYVCTYKPPSSFQWQFEQCLVSASAGRCNKQRTKSAITFPVPLWNQILPWAQCVGRHLSFVTWEKWTFIAMKIKLLIKMLHLCNLA